MLLSQSITGLLRYAGRRSFKNLAGRLFGPSCRPLRDYSVDLIQVFDLGCTNVGIRCKILVPCCRITEIEIDHKV